MYIDTQEALLVRMMIDLHALVPELNLGTDTISRSLLEVMAMAAFQAQVNVLTILGYELDPTAVSESGLQQGVRHCGL